MSNEEPIIYELDNTALIYQALITSKQPHFFRLSVNLHKPVVVDLLEQALLHILPRFPVMRTSLKRGFFWNYLEENYRKPRIYRDSELSLGYNLLKPYAYPFRILAYAQRISLETTHMVTDGRAASAFLQSLLTEYVTLLGVSLESSSDIIRPLTPFVLEEVSDAYKNLTLNNLPKPKKRNGRAFREPAKNLRPFQSKLIQYRLPLDKTLKLAKQYNVSLTTLITAIYLSAYQDRMLLLPPKSKYRSVLRVGNPVDLRKFFPTKSLRNFIGFVSHEIDPRLGIFTFEEILHQVHHNLQKELIDKHFQPFIGQNIRNEYMPLLAIIPLYIKKTILKNIHKSIMKKESSVLSNLGSFHLPDEIAALVRDVEFIPAPKYINKRDCAVISFKNHLIISISRTCENNHLEQFFYEHLLRLGLEPNLNEFIGYPSKKS